MEAYNLRVTDTNTSAEWTPGTPAERLPAQAKAVRVKGLLLNSTNLNTFMQMASNIATQTTGAGDIPNIDFLIVTSPMAKLNLFIDSLVGTENMDETATAYRDLLSVAALVEEIAISQSKES